MCIRDSSNTGPSGLISEVGRVIKIFDPNTEQNDVVNPNFSSEKTFYTIYGESPLILLFLFLVGLNFYLENSQISPPPNKMSSL